MSAAAFNMSPKYVHTGVSPANFEYVTFLSRHRWADHSQMDEQLELLYFGCRWPFGALLNFEADTISFRKALKTLTLDGAMMNKDIFSALNRNKSETFFFVEPLYSTLCHLFLIPSVGVCV